MNKELSTIVWLVCSLSLIPIAMMYLSQIRKVLSRLEDKHHDVWNRLGKPSLVTNNSINSSFKLSKFLIKAEYKRLGDDYIIEVCNLCRTLLVLGLILSLFAFIFPVIIGKMT